MYNYLDYDNDRYVVRKKFLDEMNKKTTLKDIGDSLDKFIVDEKAANFRFWDQTKDETIKSAAKDTNSFELTWTGRFAK